MNALIITVAYLFAGLTTVYICDRDGQLSEEPGGPALVAIGVIIWPILAAALAVAGLYHVFANTIDAFRDR